MTASSIFHADATPASNNQLPSASEPSQWPAAPRRRLAPNVICLWREDRPPVVNSPRRGRYPRGVEALRRCNRLRPGVYAYIWNNCLPENRGVVVQLLGESKNHAFPGVWDVRGISGPLAQRNLKDGAVIPGLHLEGCAQDVSLRRCPAPKIS